MKYIFSLFQFIMPRKYKRVIGSRPYADYSTEILEKCLEDIRCKRLSQRVAAKQYGIPRSTIINKLKGVRSSVFGGPRVFSPQEEEGFKNHLMKLAEFGFPVTETDLRFCIKNYLSKIGRLVPKFKNNMPGQDWVKSFLDRHPMLTTRFASNIKRVRAAVSKEIIEEYQDNLAKEVENVLPTHIWNYDETNLRDDPGLKHVICRRGTKYLEQVCNTTKSSTSVMFAGSASGELMPPYVVYKGEHLWDTWTLNGPKHCHYNRTSSGWFDNSTFEDWFMRLMLPRLKRLDGPKVIIGDNLASHISETVLKACAEFNIRFICLPPNSTNLTQPLDVAVFRPVKVEWRKILRQWRDTESGSRVSGIPKDRFPSLLKKLTEAISPNVKQNLLSGFRKCSIYPLNKQELLDKFQRREEVDKNAIGAAFLEHLQEKRKDIEGVNTGRQRKKKLNVPSGQSITIEDLRNEPEKEKPKKKPGRPKQAVVLSESADSSESEEIELGSNEMSETLSDVDNQDSNPKMPSCLTFQQKKVLKKDDFITVIYNGEEYPGIIQKLPADDEKGPTVSCMEKFGKSWKWPKKEDSLEYEWENVVQKIAPPALLSKRGFFNVPELNSFV